MTFMEAINGFLDARDALKAAEEAEVGVEAAQEAFDEASADLNEVLELTAIRFAKGAA